MTIVDDECDVMCRRSMFDVTSPKNPHEKNKFNQALHLAHFSKFQDLPCRSLTFVCFLVPSLTASIPSLEIHRYLGMIPS